MAAKRNKKKINLQDLKPKKDAKGGMLACGPGSHNPGAHNPGGHNPGGHSPQANRLIGP